MSTKGGKVGQNTSPRGDRTETGLRTKPRACVHVSRFLFMSRACVRVSRFLCMSLFVFIFSLCICIAYTSLALCFTHSPLPNHEHRYAHDCCLQCAFQGLVRSFFLESIMLFSSWKKDSPYPASRCRATMERSPHPNDIRVRFVDMSMPWHTCIPIVKDDFLTELQRSLEV